MTPTERAVIEAAKALALRTREYNTLIDTEGFSPTTPEYVTAANAMESAEEALIEATQPLIEETTP